MINHILISREKIAKYCKSEDGRHSVYHLVRSEPMICHYSFQCLTSCAGGINRKKINITFTLEDYLSGKILNKKEMAVRICTIPNRDFKQEQRMMQKNIANNNYSESENISCTYISKDMFWIPVRSQVNFLIVNQFAKFLDFGELMLADNNTMQINYMLKQRETLIENVRRYLRSTKDMSSSQLMN